jgi:hypothetical protein
VEHGREKIRARDQWQLPDLEPAVGTYQHFEEALALSELEMGEAPLPIDDRVVKQLMVSIAHVGQTDPIAVRCLDDDRLHLLDGLACAPAR